MTHLKMPDPLLSDGRRAAVRGEERTIMIERVDPSNVHLAGRIHSTAWKESHRSFCRPDFIESHTPERQTEYLRNKLNSGSSVYMLTDGEPVGIISVTGSLIEDLYVLPDFQNRGYGTRLLRYAMKQCAGVPTLWILENNERAGRLYRRMGFHETGQRKTVTDGLDEIEFMYTSGSKAPHCV